MYAQGRSYEFVDFHHFSPQDDVALESTLSLHRPQFQLQINVSCFHHFYQIMIHEYKFKKKLFIIPIFRHTL